MIATTKKIYTSTHYNALWTADFYLFGGQLAHYYLQRQKSANNMMHNCGGEPSTKNGVRPAFFH
uniref:Uncharacterized protein n=1 Tax=Arion vulgaris TaxID=1028688 RepID=A0A0B7B7I9_9EUPU